ncbi:hypothetical protein DUNSADRAFT_16706 [Dunaliella salina]|uniref:BAR domain-containing protein n=1 Tax=Dunaliella salina TaxID=3046 RepID=A0ABQ7G329_DUNSA|nr:hypothetical protein DUNSADRAFT_16706 [Dunaliella salina]|eukprot:KAF5829002.1 hypothetical protein DUNSADRAFT_16706 [Dunaliella salina]
MGVTWRRINERVLQMGSFTSFNSKVFAPTSNGRNEAMFAEATEFAKSIMTLQRDVNKVLKCVQAHFVNLRGILSSPTPRIYDEGPNGPEPLDAECLLLGQGMDVDAIPKAIEEAQRRVQVEVMDPLMEWMEAYKILTERMKSLESVRLELDSRRRTVGGLQSRYERIKATMTTNHKTMAETRELEEVLANKEEKMTRCKSQFQELERTVYNSLYTLVRDTSVLRDYTHSTLLIVQSCFDQAANAYSCAAVPMHGDAKPEKCKQTSKAPRNPIAGIFGKLIGKKEPDTRHHKDQETAPLALPAPPQQLLLQGAAASSQDTQHQRRAQWQPQVQQSPPSAASGTGQSGFDINKADAAFTQTLRGPDQLKHGGYAGYNYAQDAGSKFQMDLQPYPQLQGPAPIHTQALAPGNYQAYQPSSMKEPVYHDESPSLPAAPVLPHAPTVDDRYYVLGRAQPDEGWIAEGY